MKVIKAKKGKFNLMRIVISVHSHQNKIITNKLSNSICLKDLNEEKKQLRLNILTKNQVILTKLEIMVLWVLQIY